MIPKIESISNPWNLLSSFDINEVNHTKKYYIKSPNPTVSLITFTCLHFTTSCDKANKMPCEQSVVLKQMFIYCISEEGKELLMLLRLAFLTATCK